MIIAFAHDLFSKLVQGMQIVQDTQVAINPRLVSATEELDLIRRASKPYGFAARTIPAPVPAVAGWSRLPD